MTTLETDDQADLDEAKASDDGRQADDQTPSPPTPTLPLTALAPHPDNPRSDLGDLTELERSIRANGVLVPLLVLPADEDGVHLIVAGHRRLAAATRAGVPDAPVVIRAMTRIEVIEAMLSENVNRDALSIGDEVRAIEALMSLDGALTPAKLCRRIGKSQAWVRARMAVTILPASWRSAIDSGGLSLVAAEAAAGAADLGPEHLDILCGLLAKHRWGDTTREVEQYRKKLQREADYEKALDTVRKTGATVFTDDESTPRRARRVDELFTADLRKNHEAEPCHAIVVKPATWGDGVNRYEVCTDPGRHSPKRVESGKGSALATDVRRRVDTESSHAKRKGRLARLDHAVAHFAKTRGGPGQAELVRLALTALVYEAGRVALGHAATILGHDNPRDVSPAELLSGADTPGALARVAGAVAFGIAEDHMYWAASSAPCIAWVQFLGESGWSPDEWTAVTIEQRERRLALHDTAEALADEDEQTEFGDEVGESDDDSGDELGELPPHDEGDNVASTNDDEQFDQPLAASVLAKGGTGEAPAVEDPAGDGEPGGESAEE